MSGLLPSPRNDDGRFQHKDDFVGVAKSIKEEGHKEGREEEEGSEKAEEESNGDKSLVVDESDDNFSEEDQ